MPQTLSISILTTEAKVIYLKELIAETQIVKYNEHGRRGGVRAVRGLPFHSSLQPYLKSSNCIIFCAQHCNNEKKSRQSHLAMCPYLTRTMKPLSTQLCCVSAGNISEQAETVVWSSYFYIWLVNTVTPWMVQYRPDKFFFNTCWDSEHHLFAPTNIEWGSTFTAVQNCDVNKAFFHFAWLHPPREAFSNW